MAGYTTVCDNLLHSAEACFRSGFPPPEESSYPAGARSSRGVVRADNAGGAGVRLSPVTHVHEAFGLFALGANAVAAAWGAFTWWRAIASRAFWYVLRLAQASVVIQILLGLVLLAQGKRPPDELHYIYAVAPLFVALVTEAMRAGASQRELEQVDDPEALPRRERILLARRIVLREIGIMTVGVILVVTLLIRAVQSG